MHIPSDTLKRIIVEQAGVTENAFKKAYEESERSDRDFLETLLPQTTVAEQKVGKALAEYFGVPLFQRRSNKWNLRNFTLLPEGFARSRGVFVVHSEDSRNVVLGMRDPADYAARNYVETKLGRPVDIALVMPSEFFALLRYYGRSLGEEFQQMLAEQAKRAAGASTKTEAELAKEMSIVTLLDLVMDRAVANRATDIHIEPEENSVYIRYRIDGVLHDAAELPRMLHPALVARVKILADLQIDEHRTPQDGRFQVVKQGQNVSIRVSVVPTMQGEKVAMRLLIASQQFISFSELGLEGRDLEVVERAMRKTEGLVLSTGPTGSGKTTTLYTVLWQLNEPEVNIMTIEDPIEYDIRRVNQTQVNTKTGLTFATALRSFLRQNPDIIMVGEIRDEETAELTVHAALTGHLVLSTLHTEDAPTTVPRLLDLGAEPFLLSSTLEVAIGQRLVRRVCGECTEEAALDESAREHLQRAIAHSDPRWREQPYPLPATYTRGKGCVACNHSGYRAMIGIFEVLEITPEVRELILQKVSTDRIRDVAVKQGYTSMLEDGVRKIRRGITTPEEVLRVMAV